jgi:hypothetical protein
MPVGARPQTYGIDDQNMPEGLFAQIVYPLTQDNGPNDPVPEATA